eukprot:CAMPEP_0113827656 /NCGR_PEP_ID=MMETSP0328-20130328/4877_1 /TAXON_ID=39455 /ORGANISM="Alexandrium minutum" /LENGTH=197 /DNA_ID=CAMNT_0000795647 /DNA_START=285 /DNA_END=877 /DNA_ORIENTATION=+ /assembly_acc=CAM_ASM_000350
MSKKRLVHGVEPRGMMQKQEAAELLDILLEFDEIAGKATVLPMEDLLHRTPQDVRQVEDPALGVSSHHLHPAAHAREQVLGRRPVCLRHGGEARDDDVMAVAEVIRFPVALGADDHGLAQWRQSVGEDRSTHARHEEEHVTVRPGMPMGLQFQLAQYVGKPSSHLGQAVMRHMVEVAFRQERHDKKISFGRIRCDQV